ncbi:hypothetical protein ACJA88_014191 [Fusarium oxysporum]
MLQESGIPDDGYELFQQLLSESTSKWLEFCIQFEDHLSHVRLDQLKSQGKRPETISHLAENALHIAQLRRALQGQVRSAEEFNTDLGRLHGGIKEQRAFEYIHTFTDIRQQLQILDETIRDLLQFEFAWASINEAHKSTSLAISMKRLSWITFIFLPAMFAASLFEDGNEYELDAEQVIKAVPFRAAGKGPMNPDSELIFHLHDFADKGLLADVDNLSVSIIFKELCDFLNDAEGMQQLRGDRGPRCAQNAFAMEEEAQDKVTKGDRSSSDPVGDLTGSNVTTQSASKRHAYTDTSDDLHV